MDQVSPPKYFLETNVQFIRLFGSKKEKEALNKILSGSICYSSYFVLKEFHFLVTTTLIEYYSLLEHCGSVGEATKQFIIARSFKDRRIKSLLQVIADEIINLSTIGAAMARVEFYIRQSEISFKDIIYQMIDVIGCPVSKIKLNTEDSLFEYYSKLECPNNCCMSYFFTRHKDKLKAIIEAIPPKMKSSKKKELINLKQIYQKIIDDQKLNKVDLKKLGDTVITVETPLTTCLLTYDEIFNSLCSPLNKKHILIPHQPSVTKEPNFPIKFKN